MGDAVRFTTMALSFGLLLAAISTHFWKDNYTGPGGHFGLFYGKSAYPAAVQTCQAFYLFSIVGQSAVLLSLIIFYCKSKHSQAPLFAERSVHLTNLLLFVANIVYTVKVDQINGVFNNGSSFRLAWAAFCFSFLAGLYSYPEGPYRSCPVFLELQEASLMDDDKFEAILARVKRIEQARRRELQRLPQRNSTQVTTSNDTTSDPQTTRPNEGCDNRPTSAWQREPIIEPFGPPTPDPPPQPSNPPQPDDLPPPYSPHSTEPAVLPSAPPMHSSDLLQTSLSQHYPQTGTIINQIYLPLPNTVPAHPPPQPQQQNIPVNPSSNVYFQQNQNGQN